MIASTRSQNIIVLSTIVVSFISGVYLISNTSYYSGSYAIARYMAVNLEDIQIARLDPSNESINPGLTMVFNVKGPTIGSGQVDLVGFLASVYLNGQLLSLESFQNVVTASDRAVTAGYDKNFTVGSTILQLHDKQHLYNASQSGNWTFNIALTLSYSFFQSRLPSFRTLFFVREGYTPI